MQEVNQDTSKHGVECKQALIVLKCVFCVVKEDTEQQ